jgi:hypothetical protein
MRWSRKDVKIQDNGDVDIRTAKNTIEARWDEALLPVELRRHTKNIGLPIF